eukprot:CAMPEP_0181293698 /NCGR_PEP_ID=MMETSP1101-20121128/3201_1 /TAXON_ID=46948 /ORGANISM="Rhodomonas abbreviata, Strain Caron Lab Isolate" /LENGTH=572 /DNA_ID=CAMNT_0023398297 /DNA_START=70 /DNA_END=1786 /DNA_ORIENTATION=+
MPGDAASLAALTGLNQKEAASLLDVAGGDVEMAIAMHFGDQAMAGASLEGSKNKNAGAGTQYQEAGCCSGDAASLAALTGLGLDEAENHGNIEMAVSLHFGDRADEDLNWSDDDATASGSRPTAHQPGAHRRLVNRVEERQKLAQQRDAPVVKKHAARKSRAAMRREEAEALLEDVTEEQGAVAAKSSFSCLASEGSDGDSDGDSDADSDAESGSEGSGSAEEEEDDDWAPRTHECLFDGHVSASFEENCAHMQSAHSFFVPFLKYVVDAQGLFAHLQQQLHRQHQCIYCRRVFRDLEAVRKHIKDKAHCKVLFEDSDGAMALAQYYDEDFCKRWMARQTSRRARLQGGGSSTAAHGFNEDAGALVLPSGARLGHRAHLQVYRKRAHQHHGLGLTVRANRSASHHYVPRAPRAGGAGGLGVRQRAAGGGEGAVAIAHLDLQARIRAREEARAQNALLVRAARVAGGTSKALAGQYVFKAGFAYNARRHSIVHHWGAGGGGSHYHCAGGKQYNKGVRVRGVVMRHSTQGARLAASRQAAAPGDPAASPPKMAVEKMAPGETADRAAKGKWRWW